MPISSKFSGRLGIIFFDLEIFFLDPPRLGEIKLLESIKKKIFRANARHYMQNIPFFPNAKLVSMGQTTWLAAFGNKNAICCALFIFVFTVFP